MINAGRGGEALQRRTRSANDVCVYSVGINVHRGKYKLLNAALQMATRACKMFCMHSI